MKYVVRVEDGEDLFRSYVVSAPSPADAEMMALDAAYGTLFASVVAEYPHATALDDIEDEFDGELP